MRKSIASKTTLPELFFTDFNSWIQHVTRINFKEPKKLTSWDKNVFIPNKK